ncbi:MAG: MFS transporter [Bacteroidales bacterium]|nr:MFS transporter [Bacteroidales bacterium]
MFRYLDINSYLHKVGFAFRALQSPSFRLFFYGQTVSLLGTFIQNLALGWLIYRLTDSPFLLGVVGFTGQIPSLVLTPFAGVFADRLNRRKVLVVTQTISMVMALLLTFLVFSGRIAIWHIIAISVVNGMSLAFDTPFRHAFLLEMVGGKDLLQNAIALNSTLINSARFIGPTLGGFLIAWLGEGYCFLINGISFLAVIASLLSMKVVPLNRGRHRGSVVRDLLEGFRYSFNFKPIRYLLYFVVVMGFFGLPFQVFLPVFAKDILQGNSQMLGYLTGSMGAGALMGAFYLASRKGMCSIPRVILFTSVTAGVGLVAFSLSTNPMLSVVLVFFTGFGMIAQFAAVNTLIQHIVDEDKRGRVVALYGMSFMGITPIGSLLLGGIAPWVGVPFTLVGAGLCCLLATFTFAKRVPIIQKEVCQ